MCASEGISETIQKFPGIYPPTHFQHRLSGKRVAGAYPGWLWAKGGLHPELVAKRPLTPTCTRCACALSGSGSDATHTKVRRVDHFTIDLLIDLFEAAGFKGSFRPIWRMLLTWRDRKSCLAIYDIPTATWNATHLSSIFHHMLIRFTVTLKCPLQAFDKDFRDCFWVGRIWP